MTRTNKVLGKLNPSDWSSNADIQPLYTAPEGKTALISNITVANIGAPANFDISFFPNGIPAANNALFVASDNDNGLPIMISTNGLYWKPFAGTGMDGASELMVTKSGDIIGFNYSDNSYTYARRLKIRDFESENYFASNETFIGTMPMWVQEIYSPNSEYVIANVPHSNNNSMFRSYQFPSPLNSWDNQYLPTNNADGFAYGNNTYVIWDNYNNTVWSSADGYTWTATDSPLNSLYSPNYYQKRNTLVFVNNKFVATDGYTKVVYSTDGINWDASEVSSANDNAWAYIAGITHNGVEKYVLFEDGQASYVATSTDLINWDTPSIPSQWYYQGFEGKITADGPAFVALGNYGGGVYSTDGYAWAFIGTPFTGDWVMASGQLDKKYITKNRIYSNLTSNPNDVMVLEPGIICSPGSTIGVASNPNLIFSVYGTEL